MKAAREINKIENWRAFGVSCSSSGGNTFAADVAFEWLLARMSSHVDGHIRLHHLATVYAQHWILRIHIGVMSSHVGPAK